MKKAFDRLFEIAQSQQGYFTTKQAIAAGYADNTHPFHVKQGNWVREHRGIYRLAKFPQTERPDLVLWSLWSRGREDKPQGVFSYQTALSVFDLSDVMPAKLHMTVPPRFRRSGEIPKILVLHRGVIPKEDVESMHGFRVTKPLRTIIDLITGSTISADFMEQAIGQALARGLIGRAEIRNSIRIPIKAKGKLNEFLKRIDR